MDCIFLIMFTTLSYFDNSIVTKKYVRGDLNSEFFVGTPNKVKHYSWHSLIVANNGESNQARDTS